MMGTSDGGLKKDNTQKKKGKKNCPAKGVETQKGSAKFNPNRKEK